MPLYGFWPTKKANGNKHPLNPFGRGHWHFPVPTPRSDDFTANGVEPSAPNAPASDAVGSTTAEATPAPAPAPPAFITTPVDQAQLDPKTLNKIQRRELRQQRREAKKERRAQKMEAHRQRYFAKLEKKLAKREAKLDKKRQKCAAESQKAELKALLAQVVAKSTGKSDEKQKKIKELVALIEASSSSSSSSSDSDSDTDTDSDSDSDFDVDCEFTPMGPRFASFGFAPRAPPSPPAAAEAPLPHPRHHFHHRGPRSHSHPHHHQNEHPFHHRGPFEREQEEEQQPRPQCPVFAPLADILNPENLQQFDQFLSPLLSGFGIKLPTTGARAATTAAAAAAAEKPNDSATADAPTDGQAAAVPGLEQALNSFAPMMELFGNMIFPSSSPSSPAASVNADADVAARGHTRHHRHHHRGGHFGHPHSHPHHHHHHPRGPSQTEPSPPSPFGGFGFGRHHHHHGREMRRQAAEAAATASSNPNAIFEQLAAAFMASQAALDSIEARRAAVAAENEKKAVPTAPTAPAAPAAAAAATATETSTTKPSPQSSPIPQDPAVLFPAQPDVDAVLQEFNLSGPDEAFEDFAAWMSAQIEKQYQCADIDAFTSPQSVNHHQQQQQEQVESGAVNNDVEVVPTVTTTTTTITTTLSLSTDVSTPTSTNNITVSDVIDETPDQVVPADADADNNRGFSRDSLNPDSSSRSSSSSWELCIDDVIPTDHLNNKSCDVETIQPCNAQLLTAQFQPQPQPEPIAVAVEAPSTAVPLVVDAVISTDEAPPQECILPVIEPVAVVIEAEPEVVIATPAAVDVAPVPTEHPQPQQEEVSTPPTQEPLSIESVAIADEPTVTLTEDEKRESEFNRLFAHSEDLYKKRQHIVNTFKRLEAEGKGPADGRLRLLKDHLRRCDEMIESTQQAIQNLLVDDL